MNGIGVPAEGYAAALSGLPGIGPRRLVALLRRWPDPREAWDAVVAGRAASEVGGRGAGAGLADAWRRAARTTSPVAVWETCVGADVRVTILGRPGYPPALAADPEPPAVLFHRGDLTALDGPRVAVVGTRRCSRYGRDLARDLGRDLAAAGVRVVSGLALGIDGAAHDGALAAGGAPPVAVVGSGLDVVYPRRHRHLWDTVAARGVLLSEAPPGAAPEAWRFPLRNRIIAGLGRVVVVVESHVRGGSRHTVDAAIDRGVDVMAVPGSVRSPSSAGTNELLAAGAAPARDATDVLVALGLATAGNGRPSPPVTTPPPEDHDAVVVLDALGWEPATVGQVADRAGLPLASASVTLVHLERDGWVARRGPWWERRPSTH